MRVNGVSLPWGDVIAPSQLRMLAAIQQFRDEHGYSPSTRELGAILGIGSFNGVLSLLRPLAKKGLLKGVSKNLARALVPTCRIERIP